MQPWARDDVIAAAEEELLHGTELQVKVNDHKTNGIEENHV